MRGRGGVGLVGTQIFRWITTRESKGGGVGGGSDNHANFSSEHNKGWKKSEKKLKNLEHNCKLLICRIDPK